MKISINLKLLGLALLAGVLTFHLPSYAAAGQSGSGQYDLGQDMKNQPSDSPTVHEARASLRGTWDSYGQALDRYGKTSSQAHEKQIDVFRAQQHLHEVTGDYNKSSWDNYVHHKDLWSERHNYDESRLSADLHENRTRANTANYDLRADQRALASDSAAVKQDRSNLASATSAYHQAVAQHGANSPQAKAAEGNLDNAQIALHKELGDYNHEQFEAAKTHRDLTNDRAAYSQEANTQEGKNKHKSH